MCFKTQGRLVAPIHVKFGRADGHMGLLDCAKFLLNRGKGVGMRPQKFPLFGKESPRMGQPLDRFLKILGAFICPTILHQRFKFDVIRVTVYGVIADKPCIDQLGQIFSYTLQEKLCVGSKNDWIFFDGHHELYHHAKFGEDRTTHAVCRCENMVFVCFFIFLSRFEDGALFIRGVHSQNKHCVAVYRPISTFFSEWIALSGALPSSCFCCQLAPQFARNCGQKFRKSKNRRKSLCARLPT